MLVLVTIFVFTLLISFLAVRLYRAVAGWSGFNETILGRPVLTTQLTVRAQQGFVDLNIKGSGGIKIVRLRSPKGGFKSPWGW